MLYQNMHQTCVEHANASYAVNPMRGTTVEAPMEMISAQRCDGLRVNNSLLAMMGISFRLDSGLLEILMFPSWKIVLWN